MELVQETVPGLKSLDSLAIDENGGAYSCLLCGWFEFTVADVFFSYAFSFFMDSLFFVSGSLIWK
jgi:hypothetical protein